METWEEMTSRQAKEQAKLYDQQELARYKLKMADTPDMMAEYQLEQKIKQDNKMMITRHFSEAKAHPESPDLDAKWDDFFSPKGRLNMDDYIAQQKTEQQKIEEELRASIATSKSTFEQLQEQAEQQKRDTKGLGLDP